MSDSTAPTPLSAAAPHLFAPPGDLPLPADARDEALRLSARAGPGIHALLAQSLQSPPRFLELLLVVECAALPTETLAAAERLVERLARAGLPLAGGLRVATRDGFVRELGALRAAPDPPTWGGPPDAAQRRYFQL